MYPRVLERIQELVLSGDVFLTTHAEEEMAADALTIYDVEAILLSGRITQRQKDLFDYKYVVVGKTTASEEASVVCKVMQDVVVVTVFPGVL